MGSWARRPYAHSCTRFADRRRVGATRGLTVSKPESVARQDADSRVEPGADGAPCTVRPETASPSSRGGSARCRGESWFAHELALLEGQHRLRLQGPAHLRPGDLPRRDSRLRHEERRRADTESRGRRIAIGHQRGRDRSRPIRGGQLDATVISALLVPASSETLAAGRAARHASTLWASKCALRLQNRDCSQARNRV